MRDGKYTLFIPLFFISPLKIIKEPGKLPAKKFVRDGKYTIDRAKYVVTGDREVTTVLTVWR